MSTVLWITYALASTVPFVPILVRPRAARLASKRFESMAHGLWVEAKNRGMDDDDRVRSLHDVLIGGAVLSPFIACGIVKGTGEDRSAESDMYEEKEMEVFLDKNGWILGYIGSLHFQTMALQSIAKPWSLNSIKMGMFSRMVLAFCSNTDGSLRINSSPAESARRIIHVEESLRGARIAYC